MSSYVLKRKLVFRCISERPARAEVNDERVPCSVGQVTCINPPANHVRIRRAKWIYGCSQHLPGEIGGEIERPTFLNTHEGACGVLT